MSEPIPIRGCAGLVHTLARMSDGHTDVVQQKRTLLVGLAMACGADAWSWVLTRTRRPGDPGDLPVVVLRLDGGFTDAQRAVLLQAGQSPHRRVFADALFARFLETGRVTIRRHDLLDDATWHGADYYRAFAGPLGMDEWLFAMRQVSPTDVSTIALFGRSGRGRFGPECTETIDLALDNVPWLHRTGDVNTVARAVVDLTPRERQVLQWVVAGEGRKQIAVRMGISPHTVSDYLKTIYRLFGVASRGELQAKFLEGHGPG